MANMTAMKHTPVVKRRFVASIGETFWTFQDSHGKTIQDIHLLESGGRQGNAVDKSIGGRLLRYLGRISNAAG
jgi:hypothetical protein